MALQPYMEWIPIKKKQIHVRNSKQALNHGLVLKKVHRVITFNQVTLLKLYTDMNTDIKKKSKKWFWKTWYLKLMNNPVFENSFGKTLEKLWWFLKENKRR